MPASSTKYGRSLEEAVNAHGGSATSRDLDERELRPDRSRGGDDRGASVDAERLEERPEATLAYRERARRDIERRQLCAGAQPFHTARGLPPTNPPDLARTRTPLGVQAVELHC